LLLAALGGILHFLRPLPDTYFVPLVLTEHASPRFPALQLPQSDQDAFMAAGLFRRTSETAAQARTKPAILQELDALAQAPTSESLVLYVSALACVNPADRILLIPRDAEPDEVQSLLPLGEVLSRLATCPAREKLLVLDLHPHVDARQGLTRDDVYARVQTELEASPDSQRLVLCAASAGQSTWNNVEQGRTAFGYYFEQALRGYADGYGPNGNRDGRVTAREVAAFVRARVARWTERNRSAKQTPVLFCGHEQAAAADGGLDIPLVALSHGVPREPAELAPQRAYPAWLADAWELHDQWLATQVHRTAPTLVRQLGQALVRSEQFWEQGHSPEALKQSLGSEVERLTERWFRLQRDLAEPEPHSLGQVRVAGVSLAHATVAAAKELFQRWENQIRGQKPDEVVQTQAKLATEFLERHKQVPPREVALALFDQLAERPTIEPEAVRFLDGVFTALRPQPLPLEAVLVRQLAELSRQPEVASWPAAIVRRAVEATHLSGEALAHHAAYPWLPADFEQVAQRRHAGLMLLLQPGYAPLPLADRRLREAALRAEALLLQARTVTRASQLRDDARLRLPQVHDLLEQLPQQQRAWQLAVAAASQLDRLLSPTSKEAEQKEEVPRRLDELRRQGEQLEATLSELRQPFTTAGVQRLVNRLQRADADGHTYREAAAFLSMPLLLRPDRMQLWQAKVALGRRLHESVLELDTAEDAESTIPPAREEAGPVSGRLREEENTRAELRKRREELLSALEEVDKRNPPEAGREWIAWRLAQRQPYWSWQGDWHRYEARSYDTSLVGVPEGGGLPLRVGSGYASQTARQYRERGQPAGEAFVEFSEGPLLRQSPTLETPATVSVTPLGHDHRAGVKEQARVQLQPLSPDESWLHVRPLPASQVEVTLQRGAESTGRPRPHGILVEATQLGRVFHRRVELPTLPTTEPIEILVSRDAEEPKTFVGDLRLRPVNALQPHYAYARNPSTRLRKVTIELDMPGGSSPPPLKLELKPSEVRKLEFTLPAVSVPAAGQPAAPAKPTELSGPLRFRVVDGETGALVGMRSLRVDVASPQDYVRVTGVEYRPAGEKPTDKSRLSVRLQATQPLVGPPCPLELVLPASRIPALLGVKAGTLRGELPLDGKEIELTAEDLQLDPGSDDEGVVYVHIDGRPRALVYSVSFPRSGTPTTPRADYQVDLRVRETNYRPGANQLLVDVEIDSPPSDAGLEVAVGTGRGDAFQAAIHQLVPRCQRRRVMLIPTGPNGALQFQASWQQDWPVTLDTGRLLGRHTIRARLLDSASKPVKTVEQEVVLDDTPPERLEFVDLKPKQPRDEPFLLKVAGTDPVSGIRSVELLVGKPVEGKPPPNVSPLAARPLDDARTLWGVTMPLPPERKGPLDLIVVFTNGVGLTTLKTASIEVIETDPAKTAPGSVIGLVLEGGRPQPKLEVSLQNEKGEQRKETTGPDGRYRFEAVPAGKYRVLVSKATPPKVAEKDVTVQPGKPTDITLELFLRGR
jgi:hypothetical protein